MDLPARKLYSCGIPLNFRAIQHSAWEKWSASRGACRKNCSWPHQLGFLMIKHRPPAESP